MCQIVAEIFLWQTGTHQKLVHFLRPAAILFVSDGGTEHYSKIHCKTLVNTVLFSWHRTIVTIRIGIQRLLGTGCYVYLVALTAAKTI